jgi:hypothetical protein
VLFSRGLTFRGKKGKQDACDGKNDLTYEENADDHVSTVHTFHRFEASEHHALRFSIRHLLAIQPTLLREAYVLELYHLTPF